MNSDTPETDAAESKWRELSGQEGFVTDDFARKLERERDEAIQTLQLNRTVVNNLLAERDQLRKVCDELVQLLKQFDRQSAKLIFETYNQLSHVKEKNK